MLLLSTTHRPATDLGYLLHKNPARIHESELSFGRIIVAFPEASEDRCSALLALDIDPVALARRPDGLRREYVNDRPYVPSSFLSSALAEMFGTAMGGRSKERPELADTPMPWEVRLESLACRDGDTLVRSLFEPLGCEVEVERGMLDDRHPEWGPSPYARVTLKTTALLRDLLTWLYVLVPVLDDDRHHYLSRQDVANLLAKGGDWLPRHPRRRLIALRYFRRSRPLVQEALTRLEKDEEGDEDAKKEATEAAASPSLHEQRLDAVAQVLLDAASQTILDLGCGEGRLIQRLIRRASVTKILGLDVSLRSLEQVRKRLRWDQMPERLQEKLTLVHGSLGYRDARLEGFDAAALVEVIEHIDLDRLPALEQVVFRHARPRLVAATTPNREYNVLFPTLESGAMRHDDHRFEWTREEFREWCEKVGTAFGYSWSIEPLGPVHPECGPPSLMGVFRR